jgi:hypothetical protein
MIAIPPIRRALTSDLLGRHIYLFGPASRPAEILRKLADEGAQEGTVVLAEDDGTRLGVAALLRPHLTPSAIPMFSAIATLALAEAIGGDELGAIPVWPHEVALDGATVARSVVETAPAGHRTGYVVLGADIDVRALEAGRGSVDWNAVVAAFLNALDRWATVYAARGPAAVRGAMRFLPRGRTTAPRPLAGTDASR